MVFVPTNGVVTRGTAVPGTFEEVGRVGEAGVPVPGTKGVFTVAGVVTGIVAGVVAGVDLTNIGGVVSITTGTVCGIQASGTPVTVTVTILPAGATGPAVAGTQ